MAKTNQKCVRLSDKVTKYIEQYRGANFSEKLENLVLDMEERRGSAGPGLGAAPCADSGQAPRDGNDSGPGDEAP